MIAIQTRFFGPTDQRGARVKAYTEHRSQAITVSYAYGLGVEGEHDAAARALIIKQGWFGVWVRGGSTDRRGYTYTCCANEHEGPNSRLKCQEVFAAIDSDLAIYIPNPIHEKAGES